MARPCGARGFVDPGDAVLHQCIRPLIGVCAPGHHGYQRACELVTGQASNGLLGSPVFARAGKTDPPSRLILSQTSAGKSSLVTHRQSPCFVLFLCSCLEAVPSSRPARAEARRAQGPGRRDHVDAYTSVGPWLLPPTPTVTDCCACSPSGDAAAKPTISDDARELDAGHRGTRPDPHLPHAAISLAVRVLFGSRRARSIRVPTTAVPVAVHGSPLRYRRPLPRGSCERSSREDTICSSG